MTVRLRVNDSAGIDDLLDDLTRTQAREMERLLPQLTTQIVQRTKSGFDFEGKPFAPYSESYADLKRRALGQSGRPNLTQSGDMLNSVETEVRSDANTVTGQIRIEGSFNQQKAEWNQGGNRNIPPRRFFALSNEQIQAVQQFLTNLFNF